MFNPTTLLLATATLSSAHYVLDWPPTAGFVAPNEINAPCGSATVTVNSSSPEVQVNQFAVSIRNSHPAGTWIFKGTNSTTEPYNFVELARINTTGVGSFCLSNFKAPSSWAGQNGVVQVIDYAVDGTLYQCAGVRFVSGANTTAGPNCVNSTGFTATWASGNGTSTPSPAGGARTSTSSGVAATATGFANIVGLGILAVAGLAL